MLTILKDIFRPTQRKILWMFVVGVPLTSIGSVLDVLSVHGPDWYAYVAIPLILPGYVLGRLTTYPGRYLQFAVLFLFPTLQFAYYYILVSTIQYFSSRGKPK